MKESTCIYLKYKDETLFLYRNLKENDLNHGYYIGVGGKRERFESLKQCAYRETLEETGIVVKKLKLKGTIYFQYPNNSEVIYVYTGVVTSKKVKKCDEGDLIWVKDKDIVSLKMWEGDKLFIHQAIKQTKNYFVYTLKYDQGGILLRAMKGRHHE